MIRKPGSPPRSPDEPRADGPADERAERAEPQPMDEQALSLNDREWLALGDDEEETLSPEEAQELMSALSAAWRPTAEGRATAESSAASPHPALLALALEDPHAPASSEEQVAAEALAQAWERGAEHPLAELGRAALAAHSPGRINPAQNQALIQAALAHAERRSAPESQRGAQLVSLDAVRRRRAWLGSLSVLAAAAAMWLWLGPALTSHSPDGPPGVAALPTLPRSELAVSRSTGPLFAEKFDTESTSDRMDRIASARARDLRHNRYARWGAR